MFPPVSPIRGSFGAEVSSFDLRELTASGRDHLARALFDHLLLIFRGQSLSFDDQVALTAVFGDVDHRMFPADKPFRHSDDSRIQVVTNDSSRPTLATATLFWHIDQSFRPSPAPVIVLSAVTLPPEGGATMFADLRSAYDALTPARKATLESLTAHHRFGTALGVAHLTTPPGGGAVHPLVRRHPVTNRRSLFLNQLCIGSIEGLSPSDSATVLSDLYEHALKPEFIYTHTWLPGDVLVWDNCSLMHRLADIPAALRVLHRTHTSGLPQPPTIPVS